MTCWLKSCSILTCHSHLLLLSPTAINSLHRAPHSQLLSHSNDSHQSSLRLLAISSSSLFYSTVTSNDCYVARGSVRHHRLLEIAVRHIWAAIQFWCSIIHLFILFWCCVIQLCTSPSLLTPSRCSSQQLCHAFFVFQLCFAPLGNAYYQGRMFWQTPFHITTSGNSYSNL